MRINLILSIVVLLICIAIIIYSMKHQLFPVKENYDVRGIRLRRIPKLSRYGSPTVHEWTFSWDPPTIGCCDGYTMSYGGNITSDADPKYNQTFTVSNTSVAINAKDKLGNFVPGNYSITVTASNQYGSGPEAKGSGTIVDYFSKNLNLGFDVALDTKAGKYVASCILNGKFVITNDCKDQPCTVGSYSIMYGTGSSTDYVKDDKGNDINNYPLSLNTTNNNQMYADVYVEDPPKKGEVDYYLLVTLNINFGGYEQMVDATHKITFAPNAVSNIKISWG